MGEHHHEKDFEQGVMVDVGPGFGALVIYTADDLRGQEIEISAGGQDTKRVCSACSPARSGMPGTTSFGM